MSRQPTSNAQIFPKYKVPVRILFSDLSSVIGTVFVRQGQRVLDVLCDERAFFPVANTSAALLINKSHVRQVQVLEMAEILEIKDLLPELDLDYLKNNSW